MKNNKGVTLIALIVIIIVLVILAGVSISMVIGDDGVVTNVIKAEIETAKGEVRDHLKLLINEELVAASSEIVNTTDDISTKFNEPNLINFLNGKTNFEGDNAEKGVIDCLEDYEKGSSEKDKETKEIVPKAGAREDVKVMSIYRIDSTKLCSSERYGIGKNISEGNVFTLEAITETERNEEGKLLSTGKFELKYYDKDGNGQVLETLALYLTNQS